MDGVADGRKPSLSYVEHGQGTPHRLLLDRCHFKPQANDASLCVGNTALSAVTLHFVNVTIPPPPPPPPPWFFFWRYFVSPATFVCVLHHCRPRARLHRGAVYQLFDIENIKQCVLHGSPQPRACWRTHRSASTMEVVVGFTRRLHSVAVRTMAAPCTYHVGVCYYNVLKLSPLGPLLHTACLPSCTWSTTAAKEKLSHNARLFVDDANNR